METTTAFTPDSLPPELFASPYFFLLESSLPDKKNRYTIAGWDPVEVYEYNFESEKEDPFSFLGRVKGNWIGYLGYELYSLLEKKIPVRRSDLIPAAVLARYEKFYMYDHVKKNGWVTSAGPVTGKVPPRRKVPEGDQGRLGGVDIYLPSPLLTKEGTKVVSNFTHDQYLATVQRIKNYIADGDVYQVNLSQQFSSTIDRSPYEIYQRLRQASPAPYSAFLNLGKAQILSASPECFLQVDREKVTTRPIKGTRPRGKTPEEDARLKEELVTSAKDRAELMMIVDLERNDLGRVCEPGSVRVASPTFVAESFPQVHHLVATIEGKLSPEKNLADLLRATFPGGSITGAPKIRAMEIIRELEPHARGIYTGAIGLIDSNGHASFNIAIRTMVLKDGVATFCSGGGIVADSDPEQEYQETLAKVTGICKSIAETENEN